MPRSSKYSPELRQRSVRLAVDHTASNGSQWAALQSVAKKIAVFKTHQVPIDQVRDHRDPTGATIVALATAPVAVDRRMSYRGCGRPGFLQFFWPGFDGVYPGPERAGEFRWKD